MINSLGNRTLSGRHKLFKSDSLLAVILPFTVSFDFLERRAWDSETHIGFGPIVPEFES